MTNLPVWNLNDFYSDIKSPKIKNDLDSIKKLTTSFNKKFKNPSNEENFTRTTFMLIDTGTLPSGKDVEEQVDKNEEPNFEAQTVLNQGIRRYNQMFQQQMSITLGGDFELHAGDAIYIDTPSVKAETDDEMNKETGGKYIIADLCHYVTSKETYTKLNVVRDSFGRVAE